MVSNRKVEKVHRVLSQFIRPKLRHGVAFDATPLFVGITDRNIADRLDDVIGGAVRLTCGDLVCDAVVPELKRKLEKAVSEPDGTSKVEIGDDIVERVLSLLEHKLLPSELMAVRQILTKPKRQDGPARNPEEIGEDAKNAKIAYDARFPSAARIRVEPSCAPAPQRHAASSTSDYAKRFPSAMRIGF